MQIRNNHFTELLHNNLFFKAWQRMPRIYYYRVKSKIMINAKCYTTYRIARIARVLSFLADWKIFFYLYLSMIYKFALPRYMTKEN
jgi:hypothetical protein